MEATEQDKQAAHWILDSKNDLAKQVLSYFYSSIRIIYISKGQRTELFHFLHDFNIHSSLRAVYLNKTAVKSCIEIF